MLGVFVFARWILYRFYSSNKIPYVNGVAYIRYIVKTYFAYNVINILLPALAPRHSARMAYVSVSLPNCCAYPSFSIGTFLFLYNYDAYMVVLILQA